MNYLKYCSCIKCKQVIVTSSLNQHNHYIHGMTYPRKPRNYGNCGFCKTNLIGYHKKKFCDSSCAASFNNKLKPPRSEFSKEKTRISKNLTHKKFREENPKLIKNLICICEICKNEFDWSSEKMGTKRFCSKLCTNGHMSIIMSNKLKNPEYRKNYGRGKQSYMEKSFSDWLDEKLVTYQTEVLFRNETVKRSYFVDFYFENLGLIIELDGNQHLKTKEKDRLRDEYIQKEYGLEIIRVSHKEYQKQTKIDEIKRKLKIGPG